jgi:predicted ATPase
MCGTGSVVAPRFIALDLFGGMVADGSFVSTHSLYADCAEQARRGVRHYGKMVCR